MYLFKQKNELKTYLAQLKSEGKKIGFVPTMGALHDGHLSLIREARKACDIVVCSIFVNPTQFNDPKDFEKYPITINEDIIKLESVDTDVLFLPSVSEMYPAGIHAQHPHYDFGQLENMLEGAYRPNHFQGVGIIVHKLLQAVEPDALFMGQKDFQQCMIVKKLLEITNTPTDLVIVPTRREDSGLAMSSRNMRLTAEEKSLAVTIFQVLSTIKQHLKQQPISELISTASSTLQHAGFQLDYVAVCNADNLAPVTEYTGEKLVALVAAKLGEIRLIDNMLLN
ncbi:pantoate--beta-alanine ligase [Chitinophaga skermanii]|uniref:Pantothenate synthetase n=1 Tax=Chitinophaga skermanii TaxID=331697 RepID=A0A327QRG6_9BACT|nr:pantoate--beta-alanine ligase [Chitinophaga skermanii]RAJ06930.1 pantoate--beta-alanine ligase [Chitinophaga skermanii]